MRRSTCGPRASGATSLEARPASPRPCRASRPRAAERRRACAACGAPSAAPSPAGATRSRTRSPFAWRRSPAASSCRWRRCCRCGRLERLVLVLSMLLVLLAELLNSAIEAAIDRISLERHPLSGRAKDLGSAAVGVALVMCAMCWLVIAGPVLLAMAARLDATTRARRRDAPRPGLRRNLLWDAVRPRPAASRRLFGDASGFRLARPLAGRRRASRRREMGRVGGLRRAGGQRLAAAAVRARGAASMRGVVAGDDARLRRSSIPLLKRVSLTSCPWSLAEFGGAARPVSHWAWGVADGGAGTVLPGRACDGRLLLPARLFRPSPRRARARRARGCSACSSPVPCWASVQVVRGAHYVSHSLWTGWLCWALTLASLQVRSALPRLPSGSCSSDARCPMPSRHRSRAWAGPPR